MQITTQPTSEELRKLEDLARSKRKAAAVKTNREWESVFGSLPDDEFTRAAWAAGEEWRRKQVEP
jgi:hypothetical protein